MPHYKKIAIGLCITGVDTYWAMALATLISLKENIDITPVRILVATDQDEKFDVFKQLEKSFGSEFVRVAPRAFYKDLVPKMKGNYATYWKFDLFNALYQDEALMYIDVDAFAVAKFSVHNIIDVFNEGIFHLAAVPAQRPVLERVAALRLRSPFDYFNAGVLFGVKDDRYEFAGIKSAYEAIVKFDTLGVYWHDQDIFNYLFRDDALKLPYVYNVHTGYLSINFRFPALVNGVASSDIDQNVKIVHASGDFLFSWKYHPYKRKYAELVDSAMRMLDQAEELDRDKWHPFRGALVILGQRATSLSIDYYLQCAGLRNKTFASHFYNQRIKMALRKTLRFFKAR